MPKMVLIIPTLVTMTLAAGFQLARYNGMLDTSYPRHAWVVASFAVVGVMAVIAIGLLEPANIAVLFELRKPQPNGAVIEKLMRRFIYTAGITGAMQVGDADHHDEARELMVGPEQKAWADRKVPPVTALWMLSLALIAGGVSYLAAYLPKRAPLGPAVGLLAAAVAVLILNAILLGRQREFAWWRFFQVGRWALLAYIVIAGMIEYAFVYDHTRGAVLIVMTLMLVTFTLNVPILLAFTVARYEESRE